MTLLANDHLDHAYDQSLAVIKLISQTRAARAGGGVARHLRHHRNVACRATLLRLRGGGSLAVSRHHHFAPRYRYFSFAQTASAYFPAHLPATISTPHVAHVQFGVFACRPLASLETFALTCNSVAIRRCVHPSHAVTKSFPYTPEPARRELRLPPVTRRIPSSVSSPSQPIAHICCAATQPAFPPNPHHRLNASRDPGRSFRDCR